MTINKELITKNSDVKVISAFVNNVANYAINIIKKVQQSLNPIKDSLLNVLNEPRHFRLKIE